MPRIWRLEAIMTRMSSPTIEEEILEAIDHLPEGATLAIDEFSWEDYERLLDDLGPRPRLRITYDCGRLEILMTSSKHERALRLFDRLVSAFADHHGLTVEMFGSTTWKRRS